MVKKVEEDWITFTSPTGTNGIRKYMDLCKDWLITHESIKSNPLQYFNIQNPVETETVTYFGMTDQEIRHITSFSCSICKEHANLSDDTGKIVIANPFTRAQNMLVCSSCSSGLRS